MNTSTDLPITGITHHRAAVNGTDLHYVSAGAAGSPILLVHGFPETWWAFHKVIPLLARTHRVFAVDLRGFGDSSHHDHDHSSAASAEDLHQLIGRLAAGPVHLLGQDISGASVFRLAAGHPEDVLSLTGVEMGLAGFGLEALADVTHGGSWHIGMLTAPGIAQMLLTGREREFLAGWAFPAMSAVEDAVAQADIDEFTRSYAAPDGWGGAIGLYSSMLTEGAELRSLAASGPVQAPTLAVGGTGASLTEDTLGRVCASRPRGVALDGVGHYVALEAPEALADALLTFVGDVDGHR